MSHPTHALLTAALYAVTLIACSSAPSDLASSDVAASIPECEAFVSGYRRCLDQLGPGAATVGEQRLASLRETLAHASADPHTREEFARSCTASVAALKESCR